MKLLKDLNKGVIKFNYELGEHTFISLEDLAKQVGDTPQTVRMIYINKKSKFGDSPVVVTDEYLVNMPKHLMDSVNTILDEQHYIDHINNGNLAFIPYAYEYGDGKIGYSINWGIK